MAHPHCPCTRATLGELAVLMARVQKRVNAVVVFVVPNGVPEKWEETDLWRNAAQIAARPISGLRRGCFLGASIGKLPPQVVEIVGLEGRCAPWISFEFGRASFQLGNLLRRLLPF